MIGSLISDVRDDRRQCTIYRSGDQPEIERWLADHGVATQSRPVPSAWPNPFLEIRANDEVVGVIGIGAVEGLVEPPIFSPGERNELSEGYRVLFDILEKTGFSGMSRRDFLAVSREIEDRAFRVGDGTLWVCFQTLSTFRSQTEVYRTLAAETDLDIHIYGVEDWTPPAIPGITYHTEGAEQFELYWILAYDGGSNETQSCGLVAEEQSGEYSGFWTNDPTRVEEIISPLTSSCA